MSHGPGSGDRLARGAVRAVYAATEVKITEDKWAKAFDDFDPEKFQSESNQSSRSNTDSEPSGTPSVDAGEAGTVGL